jgi:hypothetical protein
MERDRDHMRAQAPWRERVVSAGWRWLNGGWRWRATIVLLFVGLASMLASVAASGVVRLAAQAVFMVVWLAAGSKHVVSVVRDIRAQSWARSGRFTWLQYPALVGGVLITLLPGYALLVLIYPTLRSSPLTSVAVALAIALVVFALMVLALALLALVGLLFMVPMLLVRTLLRERWRRYYRFPTRRAPPRAAGSPGALVRCVICLDHQTDRRKSQIRCNVNALDALSYDTRYPTVCLDEKPVVLHADVRPFLPLAPGHVERRDYE